MITAFYAAVSAGFIGCPCVSLAHPPHCRRCRAGRCRACLTRLSYARSPLGIDAEPGSRVAGELCCIGTITPAVEHKSNPRAPLSQRGPSCRRTGIGLIGRDGGFWKLDPVHTGGGSQAQLRARRFFSSLSGVLHNFYRTKPSEILQMGPALLCSLLVVCCDCFCPEHLQKFYPLRGVLNLLRSL